MPPTERSIPLTLNLSLSSTSSPRLLNGTEMGSGEFNESGTEPEVHFFAEHREIIFHSTRFSISNFFLEHIFWSISNAQYCIRPEPFPHTASITEGLQNRSSYSRYPVRLGRLFPHTASPVLIAHYRSYCDRVALNSALRFVQCTFGERTQPPFISEYLRISVGRKHEKEKDREGFDTGASSGSLIRTCH